MYQKAECELRFDEEFTPCWECDSPIASGSSGKAQKGVSAQDLLSSLCVGKHFWNEGLLSSNLIDHFRAALQRQLREEMLGGKLK